MATHTSDGINGSEWMQSVMEKRKERSDRIDGPFDSAQIALCLFRSTMVCQLGDWKKPTQRESKRLTSAWLSLLWARRQCQYELGSPLRSDRPTPNDCELSECQCRAAEENKLKDYEHPQWPQWQCRVRQQLIMADTSFRDTIVRNERHHYDYHFNRHYAHHDRPSLPRYYFEACYSTIKHNQRTKHRLLRLNKPWLPAFVYIWFNHW